MARSFNCKNTLLVIFFCAIAQPVFAKKFNLTLSGEIASDSTSKDRKAFVRFKYKDPEKKFENKISLKIDHSYVKENNSVTKNKALFDYEQTLDIFLGIKKESYITIFGRYKEDEFNDSLTQNYRIFSLGYGIFKKRSEEEFSFDISLGEKRDSTENTVIIKPMISYKNHYKKLQYKISSSLTKGNNFSIFDNEIMFKYPMTKAISLKYIIEYERSHDQTIKDIDRSNKIALGIKF